MRLFLHRLRLACYTTLAVTSTPARTQPYSLLIVGCGDIGLRVLRLLQPRCKVLALTSSPARVAALRAAGATPLLGNLDEPATLSRLAQYISTKKPLSRPLPA